jgi:hypothetical protein
MEIRTISFPSVIITLKGCQSGFFISASHFEQRKAAVNSASSSQHFFLQAFENASRSSSLILLIPICAYPLARSSKPYGECHIYQIRLTNEMTKLHKHASM